MSPTELPVDNFYVQNWGTFDVANYGDLLFPLILETELKKRLPETNFELYSPKGGWFLPQPTRWVNQIPRLGDRGFFSNLINCQGIFIGGGDIIRFDDSAMTHVYSISEEQAEKERAYRVFIEDAGQVAPWVPVLWNAVGLPFELDEIQALELRKNLRNVSYLSVRDEFSKKKLLDSGVEQEIYLVPDTVFLLERYYPKESLISVKTSLVETNQFPASGRVLCFQISLSATIYIKELVNAVNELLELDDELQIVFLPIGGYNSDVLILKELQEHVNKKTYLIKETTDLRVITSAIAHSNYFVGSSLHGNIVAYTYGIPHLFVDFSNLTKVRGTALLMGSEQQIITQVSMLMTSLYQLIQKQQNWDRPISKLIEDIDAHFDRCVEILQKQSNQNSKRSVLNSVEQANEAWHALLTKEETVRIQTQSELGQAQSELGQAQSELGQAQSELGQAQSELGQRQIELECLRTQNKQFQAELNHLSLQLQQSQAVIAAMETSKFWQLRKVWFQFKQLIGSPETKY